MQYSFSHWVLNETAHKFKERYFKGNQGNFLNEEDVRRYASTKIPSPKYEGRPEGKYRAPLDIDQLGLQSGVPP